MKTISSTLKSVVETWTDPGDYPSGAGGGPLPSRDYVESVDGVLVVELEAEDFTLMETATPTRSLVDNYIIDDPPPSGLPWVMVTKWHIENFELPRITLSVEGFESDGVPEREDQE